MATLRSPRGFSLLEALVASLIAGTAVCGLVRLITDVVQQASSARRRATALILAQSKLEDLRAESWTYTADGAPLSSDALAWSPGSLRQDVEGFVDRLDRFGAPLDAGVPHYRRRWAIVRFAPNDAHTVVLAVCVLSEAGAGSSPDACVWSIRARQP